jgi:hypothetical protein
MVFGTYSHKIVVLFIAVLKQVHEVRGICNTESLYPANFCYNGDFELPNIGTANWQVATPGNLTGWTSTQSEIGKGSYYNPRWGATQVVELATNN